VFMLVYETLTGFHDDVILCFYGFATSAPCCFCSFLILLNSFLLFY